jgi:hypothetical protein
MKPLPTAPNPAAPNCGTVNLFANSANLPVPSAREHLARKINQAEKLTGRKFSYVVPNPGESQAFIKKLKSSKMLTLWGKKA